MNNSVWKSLGLMILAILAAGCGPGGPPLYTAGGVVTYKGQPVEGATVNFAYDDGNAAIGATDAAGKFQLILMGSNRAGAAVGKGTLTVTKMTGGTAIAGPGKSGGPSAEDRKKIEDEMKEKMMQGRGGPLVKLEPAKSELPQKYGDPGTSGLKFEVLPNNNNNFVVDLKD